MTFCHQDHTWHLPTGGHSRSGKVTHSRFGHAVCRTKECSAYVNPPTAYQGQIGSENPTFLTSRCEVTLGDITNTRPWSWNGRSIQRA